MTSTAKKVRFLMIGGFLGAGKTTAIARIARHFTDRGCRVGIVTNDQAHDLVDTLALQSLGFHVGEVSGACFCCKFDELIETIGRLATDQWPDVVLTEPVGSCTDLVATVLRPLEQLHGDRFTLGPLVVLVKPEHGGKILGGRADVGFSAKAAYIFLKQLEEADVLVVNKADRLSEAEQTRLLSLVRARFPGKTVLAASGLRGNGYDALLPLLDRPRPAGAAAMELDYDRYADGEAELGWLNATVDLVACGDARAIAIDALVVDLVEKLRTALNGEQAEAVHLKVLAQGGGETAIANLVESATAVELSRGAGIQADRVRLLINARAAAPPESLAALARGQVLAVAEQYSARHAFTALDAFRPDRPVPTHRL